MPKNVKKITSRNIAYSYVIGFLILVLLVSTGFYFIDNKNQVLHDTISSQFSVNAVMKKFTEISRIRRVVMISILAEPDPFYRDELIQEYSGLTEDFLKIRESFDQLNLSKNQVDIFTNAMKTISSTYIDQTKILSLINEDKVAQAKVIFSESVLPKKPKIIRSYDKLIQSMQEQAKIEIAQAQKSYRITMFVIVVLLVLIFLLSIWIQFLAFHTTRRYNKLLIEHNEKLEITVKERTTELSQAKDIAEKANSANLNSSLV